MNYTVKLQYEAIVESHDIFQWYESKNEGLGFEFLESLEKSYRQLSEGAAWYDYIDTKTIYRRVLLDRFPCMVIYEIENTDVIIVSVRYGSEDPDKRKKFTQ